jgi:DNA polymerase zeta
VFYTRIRERSKLSGLREGVGRVIEVLEDKDDEAAAVQMEEQRSKSASLGPGKEDLAW